MPKLISYKINRDNLIDIYIADNALDPIPDGDYDLALPEVKALHDSDSYAALLSPEAKEYQATFLKQICQAIVPHIAPDEAFDCCYISSIAKYEKKSENFTHAIVIRHKNSLTSLKVNLQEVADSKLILSEIRERSEEEFRSRIPEISILDHEEKTHFNKFIQESKLKFLANESRAPLSPRTRPELKGLNPEQQIKGALIWALEQSAQTYFEYLRDQIGSNNSAIYLQEIAIFNYQFAGIAEINNRLIFDQTQALLNSPLEKLQDLLNTLQARCNTSWINFLFTSKPLEIIQNHLKIIAIKLDCDLSNFTNLAEIQKKLIETDAERKRILAMPEEKVKITPILTDNGFSDVAKDLDDYTLSSKHEGLALVNSIANPFKSARSDIRAYAATKPELKAAFESKKLKPIAGAALKTKGTKRKAAVAYLLLRQFEKLSIQMEIDIADFPQPDTDYITKKYIVELYNWTKMMNAKIENHLSEFKEHNSFAIVSEEEALPPPIEHHATALCPKTIPTTAPSLPPIQIEASIIAGESKTPQLRIPPTMLPPPPPRQKIEAKTEREIEVKKDLSTVPTQPLEKLPEAKGVWERFLQGPNAAPVELLPPALIPEWLPPSQPSLLGNMIMGAASAISSLFHTATEEKEFDILTSSISTTRTTPAPTLTIPLKNEDKPLAASLNTSIPFLVNPQPTQLPIVVEHKTPMPASDDQKLLALLSKILLGNSDIIYFWSKQARLGGDECRFTDSETKTSYTETVPSGISDMMSCIKTAEEPLFELKKIARAALQRKSWFCCRLFGAKPCLRTEATQKFYDIVNKINSDGMTSQMIINELDAWRTCQSPVRTTLGFRVI